MSKVTTIIVAAGEGKRFGFSKQFALLGRKSVLDRCLEIFEAHKKVAAIVLVLKDVGLKNKYIKRYKKVVAVAKGGKRRQDSVLSGFRQVDPKKAEIVLVHDGVRSLVSESLIDRVIEATQRAGAAIPVIPVEDTIKLVEGDEVSRTLDRDQLVRVQTPQGFSYPILKAALDKAKEENFYGTDEASLAKKIGKKVVVVRGDRKNIKITTPEDLKIAEAFLED
ncbi:MAG: 2-C-methyl-D-erythritol 4-phosphate cytidylyltransferase [Candidatus Aminicenantes bacterium]|nr:2-C-methyl-D-erythritol 4-phosphate cytidylyltransferase [Candidatus Aminicenantes bacterium]